MKVVHSLAEAQISGSSVVTIGNFDGLHRGHRSILERVRDRARELGTISVAITFDPHPLRFLAPDRAPRLIATLDQKIRLIGDIGIDLLLVQEFNDHFSKLSPKEFIYTYLINHFRVQAVCVGHNFRFGHRHAGDVDTLTRWRDHHEVIEVGPVATGRDFVSSSRIRRALTDGDVRATRRMLGRCYEVEGEIVSGSGRGRSETVPTLNMKSQNELMPGDGVYVTRIAVDGGSLLQAVTNVGTRPTFGGKNRTIETHVLDGVVPEAGADGRLRFLKRLRDEKKFSSAEDLLNQIRVDVATARKFFRRFDDDQCEAVGTEASLSARENAG